MYSSVPEKATAEAGRGWGVFRIFPVHGMFRRRTDGDPLHRKRNVMIAKTVLLTSALIIAAGTCMAATPAGSIFDFTMTSIDGREVPLAGYRGKVLLVVNVASRCGFTPQYKGLEALYGKYRERGFEVLGFPANDFGAQEPGTDEEIMSFCERTYGVTFPMFSKIAVTGDAQHPLYRFLTSPETNPAFSGPVRWNFQKYLIGRDGAVLATFASKVDPLSPEMEKAVTAALAR